MPMLRCHICTQDGVAICDLPSCQRPLCKNCQRMFFDMVVCDDHLPSLRETYERLEPALRQHILRLVMAEMSGQPAQCPHGLPLAQPCQQGCDCLVATAVHHHTTTLPPTVTLAMGGSTAVTSEDVGVITPFEYTGPLPENSTYKFDPSHVPSTFKEPDPPPGWDTPGAPGVPPGGFRH